MKYTPDHEWLRVETDGTVTIGITHHAQDALGDLVFVELPEIGKHFAKEEPACVIESVKAAGDVKMPVAGTILAVNEALVDAPEKVNEDAEGEGWFIRVKPDDIADVDGLMDEAAYKALLNE
ncbi:glycine cleavage system H protein [Formivibrio citricus]|uniref:Glycine cleavage system H protein n=1 Tax=Formivibrio citricus TaxID=83765 RepID=A0A1I4VT44_9NEIS|nr:glycine cleavage system protein GcvH [Formivibrio citricus]SFN04370.1 glycine cleavage system H protein [Formivibrio citricus]